MLNPVWRPLRCRGISLTAKATFRNQTIHQTPSRSMKIHWSVIIWKWNGILHFLKNSTTTRLFYPPIRSMPTGRYIEPNIIISELKSSLWNTVSVRHTRLFWRPLLTCFCMAALVTCSAIWFFYRLSVVCWRWNWVVCFTPDFIYAEV